MASRWLRLPSAWTALAVLALVVTLQPAPLMASEDSAEGKPEVRTFKVGEATINWNLQTTTPSKRTAELIESFRKGTKAHLTGEELVVSEKAALIELPDGNKMLPLPSELIHTMFVGPVEDGAVNYCSDATVHSAAAKAASVEGR